MNPARPDRIELTGLRAFGHHGVLAQERRDGQEFVIDVVLHLDTGPAAATDDLARTVDYGGLAVRVADAVRTDPVDLIETLAARIAAVCLEPVQVLAADVVVHKPGAPITESFGDVAVSIHRTRADLLLNARPQEPADVVLALGSNLDSPAGDRTATLRAAVAALGGLPGLDVGTVSPWVETAPVGGPPQPDYRNAVLLARTTLSPRELLAAVHEVEDRYGRARQVRWGPRTLDIDVIAYADLISNAPDLQLPHPRAHQRAFVLAPWLLADPAATLPGGAQVKALLAEAPDRSDVREGGVL